MCTNVIAVNIDVNSHESLFAYYVCGALVILLTNRYEFGLDLTLVFTLGYPLYLIWWKILMMMSHSAYILEVSKSCYPVRLTNVCPSSALLGYFFRSRELRSCWRRLRSLWLTINCTMSTLGFHHMLFIRNGSPKNECLRASLVDYTVNQALFLYMYSTWTS